MSGTTTRLGLPIPALGDVSSIETAVQPLALALDGLVGPLQAGLANDRPAAGIARRFYFGTDDRRLWFDDGAAWILIEARGSAGGVLAGSYPSPSLADSVVTAAKVHASLKPSGDATADTEALRALGAATGKAAPGLHKAQHQHGGADQMAVDPRMMTAAPWASLRGSVSVGSSLPVAYCPWNGTNLQQAAAFYAGGTPTRLTIPAGFGGIYSVLATAAWPDPVPSFSSPTVSLFLNGTTLYWDRWVGPALTAAPLQQVPAILLLAAGDYLEVGLTQSGSSSIVVPCRLDAVRVGS